MTVGLLLSCFCFDSGAVSNLTPMQILEKVDQNYDSTDGRVATITIVIEGKRATRTLKSKIWTQGVEKAFTHFLSPPREKDTKMLKLDDELWIRSPTSNRIIKIAGHMLRQSMMGSDASYEDFMEDPKLANSYDATIDGETNLGGRPCYIMHLTVKSGKNVAYHSRKIWVDMERFLGLQEELYAKSGKLLKKLTVEEVFKVEDRWYPKKLHTKDMLKEGSGTLTLVETIEFNVPIPKYYFSKAYLKR